MSETPAQRLLHELEAFRKSDGTPIPEEQRVRLQEALRVAGLTIEAPIDALTRILITQPVEAIGVRIAADCHLFSALGDTPQTVEQLAQTTGTEAEVLVRVLRCLAAFNAVREVGPQKYAASPSYAIFKDPVFENAFGGCQDILAKSRQSLPSYLTANGYRNPRDPLDTAIQHAYGTRGKSYMESIMTDPASSTALHSFTVLMSAWSEGFTQMFQIYPVQDRLADGFDPNTVMFVDVGGGLGQKAISLRKAFPSLPGRFVLQDTARVIGTLPKDDPSYDGIEVTAHDFFTTQPIVGARCYYIRQCLHNWPDKACVSILQQLKQAAKPGYSRILIHDINVPSMGSGPWVVSQDFNMMSMFAVGERTEQQWRGLLEEAGLKVTKVYLNDHPSREGIIETEA